MKMTADTTRARSRARHFSIAALLVASALAFASCSFGGGRSGSTATSSRYSHALHSRFYEAWRQPEIVGAPRGKVSVPVDVRIAPNGRVLSFDVVRSSGYPRIDRSIREVGRRVRKVARPPVTTGEYRLRINFDLDVKR